MWGIRVGYSRILVLRITYVSVEGAASMRMSWAEFSTNIHKDQACSRAIMGTTVRTKLCLERFWVLTIVSAYING